jgi:hypothetical protein
MPRLIRIRRAIAPNRTGRGSPGLGGRILTGAVGPRGSARTRSGRVRVAPDPGITEAVGGCRACSSGKNRARPDAFEERYGLGASAAVSACGRFRPACLSSAARCRSLSVEIGDLSPRGQQL